MQNRLRLPKLMTSISFLQESDEKKREGGWDSINCRETRKGRIIQNGGKGGKRANESALYRSKNQLLVKTIIHPLVALFQGQQKQKHIKSLS